VGESGGLAGQQEVEQKAVEVFCLMNNVYHSLVGREMDRLAFAYVGFMQGDNMQAEEEYRINWNIRQYSTIRYYYGIRQCFLVRFQCGQVYCSTRQCFID
jgi:hypothetical protein